MFHMLVSKLGGLLNQRIYHMPVSRASQVSKEEIGTFEELYRQCAADRGILLVQPEHLLSFKLMGIDHLLSEGSYNGQVLLEIQQFFDMTSRDIVDESDENFSPKFELMYTMGAQRSIELSPERWEISQMILTLVSRHAVTVKRDRPFSIEMDSRGDSRFPRIRTLSDDANDMLLDLVARHICEFGFTGFPIQRQSLTVRDAVLRYITEPNLSQYDISAVENGNFWDESTKDMILLIRGLIVGGILRFALSSKRWRVNYGLDFNRCPETKLAVPYRSKDSPAPRSEFSHPDVVIIFTSLTYYYGGLRDEDLFDALTHLLKADRADTEFDQWVRTAASGLPEAFQELPRVNIKNRTQCVDQIFPFLRYSKNAIDYFLSHIVFSKELKEFPKKLSASGWDIGQEKPHPVTGFSGTNDSCHVLPLSVKHLDLEQQRHTNALVLGYLLQDESDVELLPPRPETSTSDAEYLIHIVNAMSPAPRVILDVGAQILELNNHQVAERWLSMSDIHTTKAVIFFNNNEELSVMDRNGRIEPLQISPFANQPEICLVYLDEAHTRGTDIKLPRHYRAAVTLGANLTKDKLVQACMRMRKLGRGQSVVFCIPAEIQTKIRECNSIPPNVAIAVRDVLCWAISETWDDLRRTLPLWATQGRRFEEHKNLLHGASTTLDQAKMFLEDEARSLDYRYRPHAQDSSVGDQFRGWNTSNDNVAKIISRCHKFEILDFTSPSLQAEQEQEQEQELAPEIEEERQVQHPARMAVEKHRVHPDLLHLIQSGELKPNSSAFRSAFQSLSMTSAAMRFDIPKFPENLLVTANFARTVKKPSKLSSSAFITDAYQRQVQWIVSVVDEEISIIRALIILSPQEANELYLPVKSHSKVTLHLYAPRTNAVYEPLDRLELHTIGRQYCPGAVPLGLTTQLNLFAGQLYLSSFSEYKRLCICVGLAWEAAGGGQSVRADGFVEPPLGGWGLKVSPVPFLKTFFSKVRGEGGSSGRTHVGRVLGGALLERGEFE